MPSNLSIVIFLLGTLIVTSGAMAHQDNKPMNSSLRAEKLNLTPEQKKQLAEMRKQRHERLRKMRMEVKKARKEMGRAMHSSESEQELKQRFQHMRKLQERFDQTRFDTALKIRRTLSQIQKQKVHNLQLQTAPNK